MARGERRVVTCADCGARGREEPFDPMPGVCPACMDARLLPVAAGLTADVEAHAPDTLARHYRRLREAGMLPAAASLDVRTLAEVFDLVAPREALATADARFDRAHRAALRAL